MKHVVYLIYPDGTIHKVNKTFDELKKMCIAGESFTSLPHFPTEEEYFNAVNITIERR